MKTCGDCRNFRPVFALRSNTKGECLKGHMADRNYMKACKAHFESKEAVDNSDETVRGLCQLSVETGSLACMGCGRQHNCGTHGCAILRASADLHESQKARIAKLERQLAASKRREQAAVECINDIEKYNIEDLDARHGSIVWIIGKWRGPQEAGKEEAK